jgi:hypothetical protein
VGWLNFYQWSCLQIVSEGCLADHKLVSFVILWSVLEETCKINPFSYISVQWYVQILPAPLGNTSHLGFGVVGFKTKSHVAFLSFLFLCAEQVWQYSLEDWTGQWFLKFTLHKVTYSSKSGGLLRVIMGNVNSQPFQFPVRADQNFLKVFESSIPASLHTCTTDGPSFFI